MSKCVDIGTRRELFVDNFLIEEMTDCELDLKRPERREISFICDAPWEDNVPGALSVFNDGDIVRRYYRASFPEHDTGEDFQVLALAESTDGGITFERPNLGLVEFEGSKNNNILMIGGPPRVPPAFKDTNPDCEPDEQYKGVSQKWGELYAMSSPDGLRWKSMLDGPVKMEGKFDTINTAFWDSVTGCYRSFTRYFKNYDESLTTEDVVGAVKPIAIRAIQSSTSPDFVNWTPPVPNEYNDDYDDMQLYTNAVLPCPGAEHIYVGFPNRYVQERVFNPDHELAGVNDAMFMSSRDCVHWKRWSEAWVRPGLDPRNWTDRNNYPTWGIVETSDTEWSMYISEHYRQPDAHCRYPRLSIRPHGFVSVNAGFKGGEFVTKPIVFGGSELRLNYSTSAAGSVQIELQDETGTPLPGYAAAEMEPLFGDELDRTIEWNGGSDLSTQAGKPIRLRFLVKDADVFAFRFQ